MANNFASERRDTLGRRIHPGDGSGAHHFDSTEIKFAAKVEKTDTCWLWSGHIAPTGYGRLGLDYAHRVSYELNVGPIPEGYAIDHLCRTRACVNPAHLEAVTQAENNRRAAVRKDQCRRGHDLTNEENVYRYGERRQCRPCAILRSAKRVA